MNRQNNYALLKIILKIIQIALFILGQMVLHIFTYFFIGEILFNVSTLLILLAVLIQIYLAIIQGGKNQVLNGIKQYFIAFLLTGMCMFLNYEYIAVAPQEIYNEALFTVIISMIRFPLQTLSFAIISCGYSSTLQKKIYLATIVYWVGSATYQTVNLINLPYDLTLQYKGAQINIGICLLGTISANAIVMMDSILKSKKIKNIISNKQIDLELSLTT